jgi:indolepyruvate ferredoxin oxidoreductase beta subunit
MNGPDTLAPRIPDARLGGILKLAVMAVGGQGGGVLAGWIETLARQQGYAVQATSVAGVAQRTGATIYYIEMAPAGDRPPVFALMPAAGDVDILIAAELMEAGRAILRGFVTPDRTFLIASTHRALAVSEKVVPGDGIASADEVRAAVSVAARGAILFDMERIAAAHRTVISASLFGALAGSGLLPFPRAAFEAAIRAGGKGIEPSLAAFAAAADLAGAGGQGPTPAAAVARAPRLPAGPAPLLCAWQVLDTRLAALPAPVRDIARAGLVKVTDFQDPAYGALYLDRLDRVLGLDHATHGWTLTSTAAKHLANAMAYDDVIRVADRKTRAPRFARIAQEMATAEGQTLGLTEFFHPRAEEIVGLFPARAGARWRASPRRMALLDRLFNRGRRLRSDRVLPFLLLWIVGGLRRWRLRTLRHADETAHLEAWLAEALDTARSDHGLAVELLACRRLIKGYADTHARGQSKFDRVMAAARLLRGRPDAADWTRRLRAAALQDEAGTALEGALATVRSFV